MSTVDSTASSYVPSFNCLQYVEQKLLKFKVSTWEHLFTYEIIEVSQKVFTGRDFKPQ